MDGSVKQSSLLQYDINYGHKIQAPGVLVTFRHFNPSLTFADKAKAYPSTIPLVWSTLMQAIYAIGKHKTWLIFSDNDQHSSLLLKRVRYAKKFYSIGDEKM